ADVDQHRQPEHQNAARIAHRQDDIVIVRALDDHGVDRRVSGPVHRGQVQVEVRHVGAGEVIDDDGVGTAQGIEGDAFDVVEVHRHAGDIAEEPHPPADG